MQTQNVVASFRDRLPIEILVERRQGLAHARNAAVAAIDCDYFIWTDDDVTVSCNWIRDYEAAFERHPEAAFFGGPILPQFEGEAPAWLATCLPAVYTAFAGRDLSKNVTRFDRNSKELPFGANMAIRAREQRQFSYDVRLGRQPGRQILSGEESDCLERICSAGGIGFWLPSARVDHRIDRKRQSIAYLRRYYAGVSFGKTRARLLNGSARPQVGTLGARWRLVLSGGRYLWGRLSGQPKVWIRALKHSARLSGELAARRELHMAGRDARRLEQ